jgi:coenzyme F420-reducing hydrogenase beta subunit
LGDVLGTYVGYSTAEQERELGSSGGLATRLLKALLQERMVEAVVGVLPTGDPLRLFEPALLRTPEEADQARGSKYYPVEFSRVLRTLEGLGTRVALVGLPCAIRGFALARQQSAEVAKRIPYLLGLVCGRGTTKHYTTALGYLAGLGRRPLQEAQYRSKVGTTSASQFAFVARTIDGREGGPVRFSDGWANRVWGRKLLMPDACFVCTDLFAAQADVTLMDAWLPQHTGDPRGTSIAVVRNAELDDLLTQEMAAGRVSLAPVAEADVLRSQEAPLAVRRRNADALGLGRAPVRSWVTTVARAQTWWERQRSRLSKWLLRGRGARQAFGLWSLGLYLRHLRVLGTLRSHLRGMTCANGTTPRPNR